MVSVASVPELLSMWAYDLNGDVDPAAVPLRSRTRVWWRCSAGHVWQAMVSSKTAAPGRCGRCPRTRHPVLSVGRPDLLQEWAADLNGDLDPAAVRCGSVVRVWWRCLVGHVWDARVDVRALRGRGCPTCAGGRRPSPRLPDASAWLMVEWAHDLNAGLDPFALSARSGRKVLWRCQQGHTWRQAVSDRTRGRGCPACFATRGEREVEVLVAVAAATGLRYDGHPAPAPPVRGLRDLVDSERRIVVEYDESGHRYNVERDRRLTAQLEAAGYLVLRIREHGLPSGGGTTIDVHSQDDPAVIGRRVAVALAAAGRTPRPTTASTVPAVPRQSPPPMSQRAVYPDNAILAAWLPAPSGPPPTSVRVRLQRALTELLHEGVPLASGQLRALLVARTGASRSYAGQVLRQARRAHGSRLPTVGR
ncbi:zinc-ribbon domain-containing protein [Polymorphospora sp. NPDC050346]|uniref:zinc-ribbon domain-containing protein n=1 Tax=Polymorphospora sp. NPDC050346 TaxID=3155780 RepID=UPI0033E079F0